MYVHRPPQDSLRAVVEQSAHTADYVEHRHRALCSYQHVISNGGRVITVNGGEQKERKVRAFRSLRSLRSIPLTVSPAPRK